MCKKCIYCDIDNDLSESDVIPDALTNAKVINPNVCRVKHNNEFSDLFEYEVIRELAFITNALDIKSSKSKNYPSYEAEIIIDSTKYKSKITTDAGMFKEKKMRSLDGKTLLGPLDDILKIKNAQEDNVTIVDVNNKIIEKRVRLDIEVFSKAMFRLIAKIAFEWYCLRNNICKKIDEFDPVIQFITNGTNNDFVSLVSEDQIYSLIDRSTEFGSHTLLTYISNDNSINVLVSLFGIAIYNVRVCESIITECKNNILFQELKLDSNRNEFSFGTYESLVANFFSSFTAIDIGMNISVGVPIDMKDQTLKHKMEYFSNYSLLQSNLKLINEPNENISTLILKRLNVILQTSVLTVRSLKRFVKDYFKSFDEEIKLNPKGTNMKAVFMFYQLFIIGQSNGKISNIKELSNEVRAKFSSEEIVINEALITKLNDEIFSVVDHSKIILEGAKCVDSWEF